MEHTTLNTNDLCHLKRQTLPPRRTYFAYSVNSADFSTFLSQLFLWCALAIAVLVTNSQAKANEIRVEAPVYGGTGCPQGSASLSVTPDGSALGIIFSEYVTVAGGDTGRLFNRKACSLAIPVHVPAGFSMSLVRVDYQGFTEVPLGGQVKLGVEYFFAGSHGNRIERVFDDSDSAFVFSDEVATNIWSECGTDVVLRINTSMSAITNENGDLTLGAIMSTETSAGFYYRFALRSCG
jgi:hypothetical protein